jgi:hypothetical protein
MPQNSAIDNAWDGHCPLAWNLPHSFGNEFKSSLLLALTLRRPRKCAPFFPSAIHSTTTALGARALRGAAMLKQYARRPGHG